MQDHIINDQIADLARAMLELDNMDEAYRFFEDIFTIHELQAVAPAAGGRAPFAEKGHLSRDCRTHRREHGNHQPRQSLPDLRRGRISAHFGQNEIRR